MREQEGRWGDDATDGGSGRKGGEWGARAADCGQRPRARRRRRRRRRRLLRPLPSYKGVISLADIRKLRKLPWGGVGGRVRPAVCSQIVRQAEGNIASAALDEI